MPFHFLKKGIFFIFFPFFVPYSTILRLPTLRFRCVEGCWERTQSWSFKQSMGARNRIGIGLSYRPDRLHRLAELIPWNRFLGSFKVEKFGLRNEPRTVATLALIARRSHHSARSHPFSLWITFKGGKKRCKYCPWRVLLGQCAGWTNDAHLWQKLWRFSGVLENETNCFLKIVSFLEPFI